MNMHNDMYGKPMDIGDVVLCVGTGGARYVPSLMKGRIEKFTKTMVSLRELKDDGTEVMQDDGYRENDGAPQFYYPGTASEWSYQPTRFVKTGEKPQDLQNIKHQDKRFYILEKI